MNLGGMRCACALGRMRIAAARPLPDWTVRQQDAGGLTVNPCRENPDQKPTIDSTPLSDDELQGLGALVGALGSNEALNVESLDGYFTALLVTPAPASELCGADWLPAVWRGDGEATSPLPAASIRRALLCL
jgi:hypothetical protein